MNFFKSFTSNFFKYNKKINVNIIKIINNIKKKYIIINIIYNCKYNEETNRYNNNYIIV